MILPGKHLRQDRSLIGIGSEILGALDQDRTVSELWEQVRTFRAADPKLLPLSFDWFVLALSFLYAAKAVEYSRGVVSKGSPQ